MLDAGAADVLAKDQLGRLLPSVRRELACIELRKNSQAQPSEPETAIEQDELALLSQVLKGRLAEREASLWSLLAGLGETFNADVGTFFTLDSAANRTFPRCGGARKIRISIATSSKRSR